MWIFICSLYVPHIAEVFNFFLSFFCSLKIQYFSLLISVDLFMNRCFVVSHVVVTLQQKKTHCCWSQWSRCTYTHFNVIRTCLLTILWILSLKIHLSLHISLLPFDDVSIDNGLDGRKTGEKKNIHTNQQPRNFSWVFCTHINNAYVSVIKVHKSFIIMLIVLFCLI